MSEFANTIDQEIQIKFPLENFLNSNTRVFIDTCSILDDNSKKFFEYASPILRVKQSCLNMPVSCITELKKLINNKSDCDKATKAKKALKTIDQMQKEKLIQLFADKDDSKHADSVFLTEFQKYKTKYNMVLITQDTDLAWEIDNLNRSKAVSIKRGAKRVFVFRISKKGLLQKFKFVNDDANVSKISKKSIKNYQDYSTPANQVFKICDKVTSLEDSKIVVASEPTENTTLYTSLDKTHSIELKKQLASGGEGYIYETNTDYIAKIYKPENNTFLKKAKIELILSHNSTSALQKVRI